MPENSNDGIDNDVRLALSLQETSEPLGQAPSDEELVQLSEGSLSDTRYKEVLSHLATNSQLRERWAAGLELIAWGNDDLANTQKTGSQHNKVEPESTGPSLVKRIKDFFAEYLSPQQSAWGGATIAAVAAVFFMAPNSQTSKVSDIYEIWQPILENGADAQHGDIRFRGAFLDIPQDQDLKALLVGIGQGLDDLGSWAILPNARLPDLSMIDSDLANEYSAEISLGRLTALSSQACQQQPNNVELMDSLAETFPQQLSSTRFVNLRKEFTEAQEGQLSVCRVTNQLLQTFRAD